MLDGRFHLVPNLRNVRPIHPVGNASMIDVHAAPSSGFNAIVRFAPTASRGLTKAR